MESMANPETGAPDNCVYPQPGAPPTTDHRRLLGHAQPLRLLPLAARPRRLRRQRRAADRARKGPEDGEVDAQLLLHLAQPLQRRGHRPVRPGRPRRRRRRRRLPRHPGAEDPRLARLQGGRPADRQLRPGQPGADSTPPPGRRSPPPPTRRKSAPCWSPSSLSPGSTDAVAYDPYSLLASTEDLFGLSPPGKGRRRQGEVVRAGRCWAKTAATSPARRRPGRRF